MSLGAGGRGKVEGKLLTIMKIKKFKGKRNWEIICLGQSCTKGLAS